MPCLLAAIALVAPRVLTAVLWLFTDWFVGIFDSMLWPLLGFVFAPTSLLWYTVVVNVFNGEWNTVSVVGMVVAVVIDASPAGGKRD